MKTEQMELMKVIEFPKNELKENRDRLSKLDVAYRILEELAKEGHDFHIVISREATEEMFETNGLIESDYGILTSNLDKAEEIRIKSHNTLFYQIKGDEF